MFNPLDRIALLTCCAALAGCMQASQGTHPTSATASPVPTSLVLEESAESTDAEPAKVINTPRSTQEQLNELRKYTDIPVEPLRLGKGDVLSVSVYDEPDLSRNSLVVRPDGNIAFPLVGTLKVEGRSVEDVTSDLKAGLREYVQEPDVIVVVEELNSLEYTLYGEVVRPGAYPLVTDVTVTEAIAKAGGLRKGAFRASSVELADLTHAYVARDKEVLPVDFVKLIRNGDLRFDIPLRPGDYIYIPSGLSQEVYIVGEVNKASAFAFREDMPMSRTLALAEGFTKDADIARIHVIRGALHNPTVIVADFESVVAGNAQDVRLEPGDVVYVPPTTLTSWARVIDKLLPTIQTLQVGILLGSAAL